MKFDLRAFLEFKQLIVPPPMMVWYVIGFIGITLFALATLNTNALLAVLLWVIGQIYFRFFTEIFMVFFRMNDSLREINERGQRPWKGASKVRRLVASFIVVLALAGCGGGGSASSVTFNPATISCSNPSAFATTIKVSVPDGTILDVQFDGGHDQHTTLTTANNWTKNSDGSWQTEPDAVTQAQMQQFCALFPNGVNLTNPTGLQPFQPGTHTYTVLQVQNSGQTTGTTIASGSYTVTK
jgi:hypothetical protein